MNKRCFTRSTASRFIALATTGALELLLPREASAGIDACGDINVEASAQCELEVEAACVARCEPVMFMAACAASGYAECTAECADPIDVDCTAMCQGDCEASCAVDPGNFDCEANCAGECSADCGVRCQADASARCEADSDQAACEASARADCDAACDATCRGECNASCSGTPPQADCNAKCEASCSGECRVDVNLDCQVDCQGRLVVDCRTRLDGGCRAACREPEGALFCDGQYVDEGGNLEECVDALNAVITENITLQAEGNAACQGSECRAEGSASASCSAAPLAVNRFRPLGLLLLLAFAGLASGRRRRSH